MIFAAKFFGLFIPNYLILSFLSIEAFIYVEDP